MKMLKGEKWICSNSSCRSEFVVTAGSGPEDGMNPRCCCGSKMKKVYVEPRFWAIQVPEDSKGLERKLPSKVR